MTDEERSAISWAAIGARDAATLILQQVCRPDPDLDEVQRQAQRVNRATSTILDAVDEGRRG